MTERVLHAAESEQAQAQVTGSAKRWLAAYRLSEVARTMASEQEEKSMEQAAVALRDLTGYQLGELCDAQMESAVLSEKAAKKLMGVADQFTEAAAAADRQKNPSVVVDQDMRRWHVHRIKEDLYRLFWELGISVPPFAGVQAITEDPPDLDDAEVFITATRLVADSDFLTLISVMAPVYQTGFEVSVFVRHAALEVLKAMCPKVFSGITERALPPAAKVLGSMPISNPYERKGKAEHVLRNWYRYRGRQFEVYPTTDKRYKWAVRVQRGAALYPTESSRTEAAAAELGRLMIDWEIYEDRERKKKRTFDWVHDLPVEEWTSSADAFRRMDDLLMDMADEVVWESTDERTGDVDLRGITRPHLARTLQEYESLNLRTATPEVYESRLPTGNGGADDLEYDIQAFAYFNALPVHERIRWIDSTIKRFQLREGVIPNPRRAAAKRQPKARGRRAAFRRMMRL